MSQENSTNDDGRSRREMLGLSGTALTVGAAALGASLLGAQRAEAQERTGPSLRVALVDIGIVFKSYERKNALEKQINAKKDQLEAQGKEQATKIENLRKQLDLMKIDSPVWREKKKELKLAIKQFEVMRDNMEEELKLEVENLTLQILDEIEETVRDYGKAQSYDLILKVDSKGVWNDERFQERIFRAQVSSVLYFNPTLDVTTTVLTMLNSKERIEKFEKRGPIGPGGGSAPKPPATPGTDKDGKPK